MKVTALDTRKLVRCSLKVLGFLAVLSMATFLVAWYVFPFPIDRLQRWSVSPTVLDAKGRRLLSIVGQDEQWRHPIPLEHVSDWLIQATIAVEDQRFYDHHGVDFWAVLRAMGQNLAARRIVSGASTLDMQICRMMDERTRTFTAKIVESFRAFQLNKAMDKEEILELYLNIAPYGGNVRGVEAASLAYFNKHARDLSLAEAALIAGLPQSPSRYRPDRNLSRALRRQKVVLDHMAKQEVITKEQWRHARHTSVAVCEPVRQQRATHASWLALRNRPGGGQTTIDMDVQEQVEELAYEHLERLPEGTELAMVVLDIAESNIIAMLGSGNPADPADGQVNGALARRSPGSALKPFIYATAFEMERLNRESIVYDVPIVRGAWTPSNFDKTFSETLTVAEALRRSRNVPAILTAEAVGLARCCGMLKAVGIDLPADVQQRGGLALAVGGIEVTLLDLTNGYATLARHGIRRPPRLFADETAVATRALKPQTCAIISDILSSRSRRPRGMEDFTMDAVPWFMWKTGTSSGRRDAWAVGHNYQYAIGVWVGRFRGTGRGAYVGAEAAEPLLAKLFGIPTLRTESDPPPPKPIRITHPLALPREVHDSLRIMKPSSGEVFICLNGKTIIHASANRTDQLTWFLNGELAGQKGTTRLVLQPGNYDLLCLNSLGQSSRVTFSVHPVHNQSGALCVE